MYREHELLKDLRENLESIIGSSGGAYDEAWGKFAANLANLRKEKARRDQQKSIHKTLEEMRDTLAQLSKHFPTSPEYEVLFKKLEHLYSQCWIPAHDY